VAAIAPAMPKKAAASKAAAAVPEWEFEENEAVLAYFGVQLYDAKVRVLPGVDF
jgi:hypothetical protein